MPALKVVAGGIVTNEVLRKRVLARFPDAVIADKAKMSELELVEFLEDADVAIFGGEPITDSLLSALPNLKIISKFAAGCDRIDFDALHRRQIRFGYTFGVNKLSVAELAICFMIFGLRVIMPQNLLLRSGEGAVQLNGRLLTGRVVGIHGCGNIGQEVVRLLKPFGCRILACDIADHSRFYEENGVKAVDFDELLSEAEVISIHLPKTSRTVGLYDRRAIAALRGDCVLVNTARGGIVDEDALAERLEQETLSAACFDVFAVEPATNLRLLCSPRMLSTPHIGAMVEEIRVAMCDAAIRGVTENALVELERFRSLQ